MIEKKPIKRTLTQHEDYLVVLIENNSNEGQHFNALDFNELKKDIDSFTVEEINSSDKYPQFGGSFGKQTEGEESEPIYVQAYIMSKEQMEDREKNPENHNKYRVEEKIKTNQKIGSHIGAHRSVEFVFYYKK